MTNPLDAIEFPPVALTINGRALELRTLSPLQISRLMRKHPKLFDKTKKQRANQCELLEVMTETAVMMAGGEADAELRQFIEALPMEAIELIIDRAEPEPAADSTDTAPADSTETEEEATTPPGKTR